MLRRMSGDVEVKKKNMKKKTDSNLCRQKLKKDQEKAFNEQIDENAIERRMN